MRNLKKVLTLVLTLAMLLSVMVVGAGAATFGDQESITNKEAVDVCTTLNIIGGYEDGTFRPAGNVTRAEMSKMICVALNGGKEPNMGSNLIATFNDVASTDWSAPYVEYCVSQGIVGGVGGGNFNPNGNITGTQAAKMLLCILGYNASIQGYVGSDYWETNINVDAAQKGLYAGLTNIDASAPLTRDQAAQMIWNALNAYEVEYKTTLVAGPDGTLTSTVTVQDRVGNETLKNKITLLEDKYGVIKVEGVVTGNEFTNGSGLAGKTTLDVTNYSDGTKEQSVFDDGNYNVATGADELGQSVTLYVKPYSNSSTSVSRATVVGTAIVNENNSVFETGKALVDNSAKSNDITKTLKNEGLKFENSNTVTTYTNYADDSATYTNGSSAASNVGDWAGGTGAGITTTFIDNNDDGKIDVVKYVVKSFGKVSSVTTSGDGKLAVASLGKSANDSVNPVLNNTTSEGTVANLASLGLAKDDYVSYYYVDGSDTYYVEKVDGLTVDVTARKGTAADTEITASGNTYTKSALASATDISAASSTNADLDTAVTIGEQAVLYLDDYNNVIYVDNVASAKNYLMITGLNTYDSFDGTLEAKVVHQDGTTGTVKIASYKDGTHTWETDTLYVKANIANAEEASGVRGGDAYASATNVYGGEYFTDGTVLTTNGPIFKYTTNGDGAYALEQVTQSSTTATIVKGNATSINATDILNSGTTFVVKGGSNWSVYTGIANVPSLEAGKTVNYVKDGSNVEILFVTAKNAGNTEDTMVILDEVPVVSKDGSTTIYTYKALYKGEITTLFTDSGTVKDSITAVGVYTSPTINDKNITDEGTLVSASEVTACANNVITTASVSGSTATVTTYYYDDETVVYVVDGDNVTEGSISDITVKDVALGVTGDDAVIVARGDSGNDSYTANYIVVFK